MARKKTPHDDNRISLREELWPGSCDEIWDITDAELKGFATVPRLMPLVLHLIRILVEKNGGDPSSVYFELWCRDFGQGLVQISDEQECAYFSGYSSTRALRTWRNH